VQYVNDAKAVHLEVFREVPAECRDDRLAEKWRNIRTVRRVVTGALEIERAQKRIGSSLEAHPIVHVSNPQLYEAVVDCDLAEVCITSAATLVQDEGPGGALSLPDVYGVTVGTTLADGKKCTRSWKKLTKTGPNPQYLDVSPRDAGAARMGSHAQGGGVIVVFRWSATRFGPMLRRSSACLTRPARFTCCLCSISPPTDRSGWVHSSISSPPAIQASGTVCSRPKSPAVNGCYCLQSRGRIVAPGFAFHAKDRPHRAVSWIDHRRGSATPSTV
jgi:hypothetical protein